MQLAWIKFIFILVDHLKGKKITYRPTSSYFLLKLDPQILFIFNLKYYRQSGYGKWRI